jgi:hypothetical protein
MKSQFQQPFKSGITYVSYNPDLLQNLENQEGTFEVISNGNVFSIKCEDVPGHSPVITSLVPTGTKHVWLITRQEPALTEGSESEYRTRTAVGAGR